MFFLNFSFKFFLSRSNLPWPLLGVCDREHIYKGAIGTHVHNTRTDTAFSFRWVIGEAYNAWDQMKVKYICKQILGI